MRVHIRPPKRGPEGLVGEAELHFEEGPLSGMRLVGFCLWRNAEGETYVTFPCRVKVVGDQRHHIEYLRSVAGDREAVRRVKAWILDAYRKRAAAGA